MYLRILARHEASHLLKDLALATSIHEKHRRSSKKNHHYLINDVINSRLIRDAPIAGRIFIIDVLPREGSARPFSDVIKRTLASLSPAEGWERSETGLFIILIDLLFSFVYSVNAFIYFTL